MVLDVPAEAIAAMEQSNTGEIIATAFYGAKQTIPSDDFPDYPSVPLATNSGSITWDAGQQLQAQGNCFLTANGVSLVPQAKTDPLAPFGQEIQLVRRVHYADTSWDIPGGRFRIQEVPEASDSYRIMGWSAQLNLVDLFDRLKAADFLGAVNTPSQYDSTWDEVARLSPLPVVRSLPDAAIPAGVTFEGRLDAVTKLITNLGGEPALTRTGQLTARPANNYLTATETVATVRGTVTVSSGMSNDLINSVSVTNPNDANILGVKKIDDPSDPLCVDGPLGERTQTFSNPLMDTQDKADKAAATSLARLSTVQARVVKVTCLPRWDLELGDFIDVVEVSPRPSVVSTVTDDFGDSFTPVFGDRDTGLESTSVVWTGEVRRIEWPLDPTALMSFDLTVADRR